jgi:O-antigen ligase
MIGALVGTYSRVGYILFLGGVLVLGWRVRRGAAVAAVLGAVIIVMAVPSVKHRVLPSQDPSAPNEQTYESYSWRIDNWRGLLNKWEKSPIIGYGIASVPYENPRIAITGSSDANGGGYDAHNLAVKSLVEGGIVLFLGWAFLLASLIGVAARLARDDWPLRQLGRVMLVLWPLITFISVSTGEPTSETASMFALLAATGALEGAHRTWRRQQLEQAAVPADGPRAPAPPAPEPAVLSPA